MSAVLFGPDARLTRTGHLIVRLINHLITLTAVFLLGYGLVAAFSYGQTLQCQRLAEAGSTYQYERECQ